MELELNQIVACGNATYRILEIPPEDNHGCEQYGVLIEYLSGQAELRKFWSFEQAKSELYNIIYRTKHKRK